MTLLPAGGSADIRSDRGVPFPRAVVWASAAGALLVAVVGIFLARNPGTNSAQLLGDLAILLCVVLAAVSCGRAALKVTDERRGWTLLAVGATLWALGQVAWTVYGITRDHVYPFPSVADLGYLGYSVPTVAGLLLFPRAIQGLAWRLRTILDAAVIALSILFVSWATVLGTVVAAGGANTITRLTGMGYPVVDVAVSSLVLTLAMRRPAGQRRPWLLLGIGLLVLTVTDSLYVALPYDGQTALTGGPLALGWMTAWLLIALAPLVRRESVTAGLSRKAAVAIDLVPYVPVLLAILISGELVLSSSRFLQIASVVLLGLVVLRQVMIVYENVSLTRFLESEVARRTTELAGLAAIVSSSPDAILSKTTEGIVSTWNAGAERLYGWRADEIVGHDFNVLVPAARREEEHALLARVRQGEQVKSESDRLRKDGSVVPVALTVSPIFEGDVVTGMASIQQDITERRAKDVALVLARSEALESSRLKSEFLATMSHEIRTPMNGVIGLTSLLLQTTLDEVQLQYAQGVAGAGEALLTVINDILDFSKLEAGKVELDVADVDPRQVVEDVASLLAPAAQLKGLELIGYCLPDVPAVVRGDAGRIRQILLNLASNAVKFTATGEVVVKVRTVGEQPNGVLLRFEVNDTGIGVSAGDRTRLFESFSQADASTTRRYGGTGLGLAISRKLTDAMHGEIGMDSEVGVGSTFWFEVPLPVGARAEQVDSALDHDVLAGVPVLVVDDNATNRLVLEGQLTSWGMRPQMVEHPGAVLALLRDAAAVGRPYPVAVLDMCMPEIDGLDLARLITADETLAGVGLLLLTSAGQVPAEQLQQAGIAEWLTKPVRSSEFYDRLIRLLTPSVTRTGTPAAATLPDGAAPPSLGRVLVVEDNALNQLVAEGVVGKLGYQVDIVANGLEALHAISATYYSAVLMDCHMPVMDGFQATIQIRLAQSDGDRIPIIAMTAGAMEEDRERCLAVGMDDYVSKPVNVAALRATLTRWARPQPAPIPA